MLTRLGPTFSRPSGDVGLHLRPVSQCFGPDAEVIGDAISQVFDLHPQRSTALHIYCHYLTDTWSARRGVCTENTKTLDAAFHKRQIAKLYAYEQMHTATQTHLQIRRQTHDYQGHTHLCIPNRQSHLLLDVQVGRDTRTFHNRPTAIPCPYCSAQLFSGPISGQQRDQSSLSSAFPVDSQLPDKHGPGNHT